MVVEAPERTVGTAVQSYKLDAAVVDGGERSIFPWADFTWGGAGDVAALGRKEGRDGWAPASAVCRRGPSTFPRAVALSFRGTCGCAL